MAVKKTQMYRRNLDGTETNLNPLTESQYVLMENGQTVQEVLSDRDSDKYTPVITNSSSTFKVGQGDNVDLSSSMKEGAYDSCVLKGKTMVNCIQEPSSKDVVLPYEFADGQYVTINDTKESGALGVELKGQTLVNLFQGHAFLTDANNIHTLYNNGVYNYQAKEGYEGNIAPAYMLGMSLPYNPIIGRTYTVFVTQIAGGNSKLAVALRQQDGAAARIYNEPTATSGLHKFTFTHDYEGEYGTVELRLVSYTTERSIEFKDIVIVEGDYTNVNVPYFEGMTSCKMPILRSANHLPFSKDGLICWLDGSDGAINNNTWTDRTGNGNNATLIGFSHDGSNGWTGDSLKFDGVNAYCTLPPCVRDDFTINMVVNVTKGYGSSTSLWYLQGGLFDAEVASISNDFGLTVSEQGQISAGVGNPDTTVRTTQTYLNEKVYITFTRDKELGAYKLYINGELQAQGSCNNNSLDSPQQFLLGAIGTGLMRKPIFDCYSVMVYNRVLTQKEISMNAEYSLSNRVYPKDHKSSILSLPEEVVLRSLPNGVCDTFNTRTGVYTRRIGEVVFDGSEHWVDYSTPTGGEDLISFLAQPSKLMDRKVGYNNSLCDKMKIGTSTSTIDEFIEPHPSNQSLNNWTMLRLLKTRLSAQTVQGLREWLTNNPLTLQYELTTPIVTKVNLSSTLKSWNTTTHIYSEIQENTLYPILSHSNPSYPVILKPSTKYSIVANSYSNNHTNSAITFNLGGATASTTVGSRVTTVATPSTLSNELLTMSGRGNKLNNVMVIEGDVMGDEPYFEGICDCKSPILSNIGKNLFDLNQALDVNNWVAYPNKPYRSIAFKVKPKTTYSLSCSANVNVGNKGYFGIFPRGGYYATEDGGWNTSLHWGQSSGVTKTTFTTLDQEVYYMSLYFDSGFTQDNVTNFFTNRVVDIQIEEASAKTAYEPYKSNTTTFNQKDDKTIVLRSLSNGICDTLNVETGEHVQRIGESSEFDVVHITLPDYMYNNSCACLLNLKSNALPSNRTHGGTGAVVCNKFPHVIDTWTHVPSQYGVSTVNGNFDFAIRLPNSKTGITSSDTVDQAKTKFRNWLLENPITIQYELATPIVSTIDVQGFPYAYKDGHVQLSSGHSGQSLTPKVEYSLSANKTGQINSNTKRVSAHQKQLDDFEAMMLTSMVQSAYDKAILQFDYEMQMMSLGGE